MTIAVDVSGARAKVEALKKMGLATEYQLTKFGARAILSVKTAGILKTKSGQLMRNIGLAVHKGTDSAKLYLGTGIGRAKSVKYADIHDRGGEIRPKNAKMLTIPLAGVRRGARARDYGPDLFVKKTITGHLLLCKKNPKRGFRALFLLVPKVTIPARRWFSGPLEDMRPELDEMLSPDALWQIAQRLGE